MRIAGYDIYWKHFPEEGITRCTIELDGKEISTEDAKTYYTDSFVKKIGRRVSLTKALTSLVKSERTLIWSYIINNTNIKI